MPEQQLPVVFRKYGGLAARGLVTGVEFANRVLDEFASLNRVDMAVIPALWDRVPDEIRNEFAAAIRRATGPGFRYHAFHIGGNLPPPTEDELRRDADLRTARVQAWAVEFVRFLDGIGA